VTVLLVEKEGTGIVERRPGLAVRLVARLRAAHLDRALAGGATPESGLGIAVHAERLVRPRDRRHVAATLERLLVGPRSPSACPVPLDRRRIDAVEPEIRRLADLLAGPGPVTAVGVARVRVLLTDGAGLLLGRGSVESLRHELRRTTDALQGVAP
jgi:hypothetical protein